MDDSLPEATAVGVIGDRIVAVGDLASMDPWREGREVIVDERLADKVLMPGFIDNHLHPYLGAIMTPMEIIAPEAWRIESGRIAPAADSPERYRELLVERLAAHPDKSDWFITFGYQPSIHGRWNRAELDELCPDRPVILWQRSYHETYLNSAAIEKLGLSGPSVETHPQVDLSCGHFFETGNKLVANRLMPYLMRPEWYHRGLNITADLMQQGGVTTAGDLVFGAVNPDFELAALDACIAKPGRPLRIVNVCEARGFSHRAVGHSAPPTPTECPDFAAGLEAINAVQSRGSRHVIFSKAVKLFADGAMFSQLMQMKPPGYIDGHHGEWLMSPEVLAEGVKVFWNAGYQIHVHVNGDAGMDSVLASLAVAQEGKPRFDHRFMMHHVGFHTNAQSTKMAALGAHASVNPYFIHALADDYSLLGLGPERASQIVRAGSLLRSGIRVSFHSDFMMAPIEPLMLAWCAATRTTKSGRQVSPEEQLTLEEALRGITIDAAFGLHMDHEIGSIVAGKKADFTVLEDDPYEFGVKRLKDIRVSGTVFEGEVHLLAQPLASVLSEQGAAQTTNHGDKPSVGALRVAARSRRGRYRPVPEGCCATDGDPCIFLRQLAVWAREQDWAPPA
ncbi:amidohydrolase [Diaphorobacter sp.]|uniref:amidohydrolase n=1 Tax=Diaphorobacter sp. TaxID=1934310 RepID=UPI0028ABE36B|nr:amidohydrolase [Diaphorobacter sp.]